MSGDIAMLRKFPEKTLREEEELERARSAGEKRHAANIEETLRSNGHGTVGVPSGIPGVNFVRRYTDPPYNTRVTFVPDVKPGHEGANFIEHCGFYGQGARGTFNVEMARAAQSEQELGGQWETQRVFVPSRK